MDISNLFSVKGKTALVTGGTAGLGLIIAEALLRAGARVMVSSRKAEQCATAQAHLSQFGSCEAFVGNVGTEAGVKAIVAEVQGRADRLDILINNAGISWGEEFETFPWSAWDKVLSVNITGLFTLTRDLMPMLLAAGTAECPARVVNMGSVTGTVPIRERAYSYSVSKAGVHHLTRMLSNEVISRHVTVNAIAPGPFESKMTAFALKSDKGRDQAARSVPAGRIGSPEDLAGTILFLCGRAGAYTSGAVIPLDGGMSASEPPPMWV